VVQETLAMRNYFLKTIVIAAIYSISTPYAANILDIVTYGDVNWHSNIVIKRIDLEQKAVIQSTQLSFGGEIITKNPIRFSVNNSLRLIISTDGVPGKNCEARYPISYYAFIDDSLNVIYVDSIPHVGIYDIIVSRNDSLILLVSEPVNDIAVATHYAKYSLLNNLVLNQESAIPASFNPDNIPIIGTHNNLRSIGNNRGNLFWDLDDNFKIHLFNINQLNRSIRGDLIIGDIIAYSQLLALSLDTSSIYAFSLSYDIPHGGGLVSTRNTRPSYLKKYSVLNFQRIDSIAIPNLVADSDYTSNEHGLCHQKGPYLYYYFFKSDDYRYFSPAMLFIFDTRTNEARWLRVGWR
jgi:hypothetical protein